MKMAIGMLALAGLVFGGSAQGADKVSLDAPSPIVASEKGPVAVTATVSVQDAKNLEGATYCFVWGDGSISSPDDCVRSNPVHTDFWSASMKHEYPKCGEFSLEVLFYSWPTPDSYQEATRIKQKIVIKGCK